MSHPLAESKTLTEPVPDGSLPAALGSGSAPGFGGNIPSGSSGRRIRRNIVWSILVQFVSWVLTFAVTQYLPRYIGDAGMGKIAFATAFVALIVVVAPLGTTSVLVTEIARDRTRARSLLKSALLLCVPMSVLLGAAFVGIARFILHYDQTTCALILIAAICSTLVVINNTFGAVFQGQENLPLAGIAQLSDRFSYTGVTLLLIVFRAPLLVIAAVPLLSLFIGFIVNVVQLRAALSKAGAGTVPDEPRAAAAVPNRDSMRLLIIAGLPFLGLLICRTLYGQTDPLILRWLTGNDSVVGWYALAYRLVGSVLFLPGAVTAAMFPTFSRLFHTDTEKFHKIARTYIAGSVFAGLAVGLLVTIFADPLVHALGYSSSLAAGVTPVLQIGGINAFLNYVAMGLGTLVFATKQQGKLLRAYTFAMVVAMPWCWLCSALAQRWTGNAAIGAIFSDAVLEAVLIICYSIILPRSLWQRGWIHDIRQFAEQARASLR